MLHAFAPIHAFFPDRGDRPVDVLSFEADGETPQVGHLAEHGVAAFVQDAALMYEMAQGQRAVAAQVDVPHLDVRLPVAEVILVCEVAAQGAVAGSVVDGVAAQLVAGIC